MKNYKKAVAMLLTAVVLLVVVFKAGANAQNVTASEANTHVYGKLARGDASSVALHGDSFTNVDGVACPTSDSPNAPANVPSVLTPPIPEDSNTSVTTETTASALSAVQTDGLHSAGKEAWKTAFEKSLFENYGVKPHHYEELENGVYQVYAEIDGKVVPYVAVNSKTGDYHG